MSIRGDSCLRCLSVSTQVVQYSRWCSGGTERGANSAHVQAAATATQGARASLVYPICRFIEHLSGYRPLMCYYNVHHSGEFLSVQSEKVS